MKIQPLALLTLIGILASGFQTIAAVQSGKSGEETTVQTSQREVAQATMCRRVIYPTVGLVVREKADPKSRQVGSVGFNQQITLASNTSTKGQDGRMWIQISGPVSGYISNGFGRFSNLGMCRGGAVSQSPATTPTATASTATSPDESLCRRVDPRVKQGVVIRAEASSKSAYRGSILVNGEMMLISGYKAVADNNGENREWVEITSPARGFVATNNLIMCR